MTNNNKMETYEWAPSWTLQEREIGFTALQKLLLETRKPIYIGRLSGVETAIIGKFLTNKPITLEKIRALSNNAGIYCTNEKSLLEYIRLSIDSFKHTDLLGVFKNNCGRQNIDCLYYLLKNITLKMIPGMVVEPFYYFEKTKYHSGKLEYRLNEYYNNKTILIITSHIHSCKQQVENGHYKNCFAPYNIFGDCTFKFVKPPVTLGGMSQIDWLEHYEKFKEDLVEVGDFDVALVSCGGYATPVCDFIYTQLGKSCIYIGGPLQLFFGVIGRRWYHHEVIKQYLMRNRTYWIQPLKVHIPPNAQTVEVGRYW